MGGNSDQAAAHFARFLVGPSQTLRLGDYRILPCTGCGACAYGGGCILHDDQAESLFSRLDSASGLVLTAPVYFYHLPAQAKAWIDRSQARYLDLQAGRRTPAKIRPAYVVLLAGRKQGEKLFAGILPTLKYFFEIFDYRITGTAFVRGVDASGDFLRDQDACSRVQALSQGSGW